ncbi:MAG: low molecular weight phosphotyrosine protein phosphatase [Chlamydiia bacterium]|nr:low molecular weight phosphotyrosine protein phosphatase [Chlamydiia bacterium]
MHRFLFVCVGNICRSPALQGYLEHLLKERGIQAYVDSCGLHGTFQGNSPDRRMQEVANNHGISLNHQAKIFEGSYFDQFDAIFCVTKEVLAAVQAMAHTKEHREKVMLATCFLKNEPIPDPYFNAKEGFEQVWTIVEKACQAIVDHYYSPG